MYPAIKRLSTTDKCASLNHFHFFQDRLNLNDKILKWKQYIVTRKMIESLQKEFACQTNLCGLKVEQS